MVERTNGAGIARALIRTAMTTAKAIAPRCPRVLLRAGVIAMKRAGCRVPSDGNPRVDSGELMVDGRNGGASINYQPSTINELWLSRHASAFTLIELLVVIAIIAVLAALIFPAATA